MNHGCVYQHCGGRRERSHVDASHRKARVSLDGDPYKHFPQDKGAAPL
jgi:hypothetical protein